MFRKSGVVALALALTLGATARADIFLTDTGTVNQVNPATVTLVQQIDGTTLGGVSVNNNVNRDSGNVAMGDVYHNIAVDVISGYNRFGNPNQSATGAFGPAAAPRDAVVITATIGHVTATTVVNGVVVAASLAFDQAKAAVFTIPTNTFNPNNPATWGFNPANLLATFGGVIPPNPVAPGTPNAIQLLIDPSLNNFATVNALDPSLNQGRLQVSTLTGNLVVPDPLALPPGFVQTGTGLQVQFNEQLVAFPNFINDTATLNNIFNFLLPGQGGFTQDPFNPSFTAGQISPDFISQFGSAAVPGIIATTVTVPEIDPASMAGALAMLGAGWMMLTSRRKRK
jgi:hypothetical protein